MTDYLYQTLQVENRMPPSGGPSPQGQAIGAFVRLFQKFSVWLNGEAVSFRVNRELEQLDPEIQKAMPANGGVLVCVGIQEWKTPDAAGAGAQSFLSIHIAGSGISPESVLKQYLSQPGLVQDASEGSIRKDQFVWVTRK